MTLDNFEKSLSSTIQKQGYIFFTQKKVDELEQADDKWVAFVRGKDNDFDVTVTLKSKNIISYSCDCESDELCCEHVAALLYAVQAHVEGTKSKTKNPKTAIEKAAKPKKPAKPETFAELLEKVPADELRAFLKENFVRNKDFKNLFMARFMISSSSVEGGKEKFLALVENAMKIGFDRNGYADSQGIKKMLKPLKMLVSQAKTMVANGEYVDAVYIGEALLQKITGKLEDVYDVNDIQEYAFEGMEIMADVMETDAPQHLKDTIWKSWLEMTKQEMFFQHNNLGNDLYETLIAYTDDAKKEEWLIAAIKEKLGVLSGIPGNHNYMVQHDIKKMTLLQLELYHHRDNTLAAQAIIEANLEMPEVRKIQVGMLIAAKEYSEAKRIVQASLQSLEQRQGLNHVVESWETLLQIAQLENDEPEIRRLAKELWEKSNRTIHYYNLYKNTYNEKIWTTIVDTIIENHKTIRKDYSYILIEEKRWAQLLARITDLTQESQRGHIWGSENNDIVAKYDEYLLPHFPEELAKIYKEYIYKSALNATDRSAYFSVGLKLKRLATYPNQLATANQLANALMNKYANRPAFVEELGKIKWK